jgi:glycosyltransferase involved in cell wall biosynthesis
VKILHLGKYYYPYAGGMESVVKDLCEGLFEKGHDVTVLCSHDKASLEEEVINGVKVVRVPRTGVLFGQNINPSLYFHLQRLSKDADLVHVHCPHPQAESLALSLPKDVPVVATYHSDVVRQKTLLKFYKPVFNSFLKRVKKVYVPTQNHIDYSQFLIHNRQKCEIIPFGIREAHLKSSDSNLNFAREFRAKHGPYALFVGRLVGYKGLPVLVEAAKKVDKKVVIVGDGPDRSKIEQMIKDEGLEDKVIMMGKVTDDDAFVGLYHGCEMLVLPSVTPNENFGVVQLEAMACSKPVVTTNLKSGVPAVGVKNETCLIVNPGDANELSDAMNTIFNDSELKNKLGKAGRDRFDAVYTWDNMISSQISSYRKTIDIQEIIKKHSGKKAA